MRKTIETLPEGWEVMRKDEGGGQARHIADDGRVELAYRTLMPGVLLTDIDLKCSVLPASFPIGPRLATVNWCASGRCEVDFGDQGSLVVSKGELCLSSALAVSFSYPTGVYRGFELFVDLDAIDEEGWATLASFGLTDSVLAGCLCQPDLGASLKPVGRLATSIEAIETELANDSPRNAWLLLRVLELLMLLVESDRKDLPTSGSYLLRSQRDMARTVYRELTANTGPSADLAPLAGSLGVSEASLRNYFSRMYGESPAVFARRYALAEAARLLTNTDQRVAEVGLACGYVNPSKFSAAFRRAYGVNPLEYRRRSRLM